jgi:hypothetical protein
MTDWPDIIPKARMWRDRPPSGNFILHRIPRDHWCPKHGLVPKWHECDWHKPKSERPVVVKVR